MDSSALAVGEPQSFSSYDGKSPIVTPARGERTAVLVVHGMGQQRKFETLSEVVDGIEKQAGPAAKKTARNVQVGGESLSRIELELADGRKVDVYEAYWAYITEGAVSLRDVMTFLKNAARNGFRNSTDTFRRWVFGKHEAFTIPKSTKWFLVLAAAVLAALVFLNTMTTTLAAVKGGNVGPEWLRKSAELPNDLTAAVLMLLASVLGFAAVFFVAKWQKTPGQSLDGPRAASKWGVRYFIALCLGIVLVAAAMGLAVLFHRNPHYPLWRTVGHATGWLLTFASAALVAGGALICMLATTRRRVVSILLGVFMLGVAAFVIVLAGTRSVAPESMFAAVPVLTLPLSKWLSTFLIARWIAVWVALALVTATARRFLIQYVGDVAAYVTPNALDKFDSIRERIRDCTGKAVSAIYHAEEKGAFLYGSVAIVGHSLGSVAAYDCLNRILNEDAHLGGTLEVIKRTTGLITFGSPLDKTAFIFETNIHEMTRDRAALAATVQPMIENPKTREIRWTNIHSPWDIISGDLNFYGRPNEDRVVNEIDYDAVTPLGAHTEYWKNPHVWRRLEELLPPKAQVLVGKGPKLTQPPTPPPPAQPSV